jgi:hypothetical protein
MLQLLDELIIGQRAKLLKTAKRILPHVIEDDLLQPNDFPELEMHPHFRYEEGILDGMQVAKAALLAELSSIDGQARSCQEKSADENRMADCQFN